MESRYMKHEENMSYSNKPKHHFYGDNLLTEEAFMEYREYMIKNAERNKLREQALRKEITQIVNDVMYQQ